MIDVLENEYLNAFSVFIDSEIIVLIAWPKMSDDDSWSQLDSAVYSRLVGASSIQEKVELLENTIYDQATCIFGHPSRPNKSFRGLNRRACQSINLCIEKNSSKNQIKKCNIPSVKQSLQALLRRVMLKLRNIRKGERNRKKRWKIKNGNKSFFQNPKNILDPKCNIKLTVDKGTLDKHKVSSVGKYKWTIRVEFSPNYVWVTTLVL